MTEFDDDAATASAMTANRVRFMIRLYRGGASNSPFSHGVIIEIQRVRGDPITFHRSSRAILSAAQGDSNEASFYNYAIPNHGMGLALDTSVPGTSIIEEKKGNDSDVLAALEIDWTLIKKDRMDANILGWESLALLTNETGSGGTTALVAGRVVLGMAPSGNADDEGEDERHAEIHASVISLIRDRRMIAGDAVYDFDDLHQEGKNDADHTTADEMAASTNNLVSSHSEDTDHIIIQRSLAIRSLANSLEVVARAGDARFTEHTLPYLITNENIVPSLLEEVAQSALPNNPFNASDATHAARALRVLFENSGDARNIGHARNALSILSKARSVGAYRHAALEHETRRAFQALNDNGNGATTGATRT